MFREEAERFRGVLIMDMRSRVLEGSEVRDGELRRVHGAECRNLHGASAKHRVARVRSSPFTKRQLQLIASNLISLTWTSC